MIVDQAKVNKRYHAILELLTSGDHSTTELYDKMVIDDLTVTRHMVKNYLAKLRSAEKTHICRWVIIECLARRGTNRRYAAVFRIGKGENVPQPDRMPPLVRSSAAKDQFVYAIPNHQIIGREYTDLPLSFFRSAA